MIKDDDESPAVREMREVMDQRGREREWLDEKAIKLRRLIVLLNSNGFYDEADFVYSIYLETLKGDRL